MPSRIIRQGINDSERVDRLSEKAEIFYRRLLNVVDDYGRFDARPALLIAACYPLRAGLMRMEEVESALRECTEGERPLIIVYTSGGKEFLEIQDFRQQLRSKQSKYPDPPSADAKPMAPNCASVATHTSSVRTLYPETKTETYIRASDAHAQVPADGDTSLHPSETNGAERSLSAADGAEHREAWFANFWKKYSIWRNRDKKRAHAAFKRTVTNRSLFEAVMAALDAQTPEMMNRPADKRPYAGTWLNGERWNDQPGNDGDEPHSHENCIPRQMM
jgi:hypothetical protein